MKTSPYSASTNAIDARPRVLVLGATGGLGGAVTRTLLARDWDVVALTRHADPAGAVRSGDPAWSGLAPVQWRQGDAMSATDVLRAAEGARFIVQATNPPRYTRWRDLALPMLAHGMEAARAVGARLVLPGNVYNFGPDAGALVDEHAPQHPRTRKGAIRVEMERMLASAATAPHPLRSLVVRAGDFFGPHAPASWFMHLLVKPGRPVRRIVYPGTHDVGHAWAYLPDLAEAMVRLMELDLRDAQCLAPFEVVHFGGHWLPRGVEMGEAIRRVCGDRAIPIRPLPWALLALLSPFVEVLREMREMRYLWDVPLQLDNRKLTALLGSEPHTPLDQAVRATLAGLGCLPGRDPMM